MPDVEALVDAARPTGCRRDGDDDTPTEAERRLLAHLLLYHHREGKPAWWRYFDLRGMPLGRPDRRARRARRARPRPRASSRRAVQAVARLHVHVPAAGVQARRGRRARTRRPASGYNVVPIEDDRVVLRRGDDASRRRRRPALIDGRADRRRASLREALVALARVGARRRRPLRGRRARILRREPPRLTLGHAWRGRRRARLAPTLGLDRLHPAVQGPPGHRQDLPRGAHDRRRARRRAARRHHGPSHAAIQNLLREVEKLARDAGVELRRRSTRAPATTSRHGLVEATDDNDDVDGELPARRRHRVAVRPARAPRAVRPALHRRGRPVLARQRRRGRARRASNVVLLGDPQQLPQVTQADHPGGSGASVLEHLLDGRQHDRRRPRRPAHRDLAHAPRRLRVRLRAQLRRLLRSRAACARRARRRAGAARSPATGLRALAVDHEGRSQASPEEAEAIAAACRDLLAGGDRDRRRRRRPGTLVGRRHHGRRALQPRRPLHPRPSCPAGRARRHRRPLPGPAGAGRLLRHDLLIRRGRPARARLPLRRNRLNVAVSRAQCLAVLVHCPRLLDADCRRSRRWSSSTGYAGSSRWHIYCLRLRRNEASDQASNTLETPDVRRWASDGNG